MTKAPQVAVVDWRVPSGKPDWLLGTGATVGERALVWASTALATAAAAGVASAQDVGWAWWQWLLVLALTVDVAGGVPANALGTAKRFYHSAPPSPLPVLLRLAHDHIGFAALHVHPFVVAALIADATLAWAAFWYVIALAGTVLVVTAPLYLRRPLAAAVVTTALVVAPAVTAPAGLAWFGSVLVVKLVAAHAVREEPYRPVPDDPPARELRARAVSGPATS